MEGILDLLKNDLGQKIVSGIADDTKQSTSKTADVLTMALPLLTKAMQRNASKEDGADSLSKALESKHDGSILNNLDSFFGGGVDNDAKNDGAKILGHILGNKQGGIEKVIGQKTNTDSSTVANILKVAAPILLGYLGNQKKKQSTSGGGIGDLLGDLLGGNSSNAEQSFLEKILDADGDGSVVDDVAGMFLDKGSKKTGGLGGLLGGLFGK